MLFEKILILLFPTEIYINLLSCLWVMEYIGRILKSMFGERRIILIIRHFRVIVRHLTIKKLFNLLLNQAEFLLRLRKLRSYPVYIKIEPTRYCHPRCPGCIHSKLKVGKYMLGFEDFKKVVDPRMAVELITENFIHCLLKGLQKAPRINYEKGMSVKDIQCMVSPYGCFGAPHQACLAANVPVIAVRENKCCLNHPENAKFISFDNYI